MATTTTTATNPCTDKLSNFYSNGNNTTLGVNGFCVDKANTLIKQAWDASNTGWKRNLILNNYKIDNNVCNVSNTNCRSMNSQPLNCTATCVNPAGNIIKYNTIPSKWSPTTPSNTLTTINNNGVNQSCIISSTSGVPAETCAGASST